jgi:hypothetical protein
VALCCEQTHSTLGLADISFITMPLSFPNPHLNRLLRF